MPRTAGPPSPHTAPTSSGKRAPAACQKGREVGGGRARVPGRPTPRQEPPPPRHPYAAPTARKSARCGVGDGSPRPQPPHCQPVGSGPRPHARTDEWSGQGERSTPEAPCPGNRRLSRAPSCRPHSAQGRLARVRAVGSVTGPHARNPGTHSQGVVGPGRTPERKRGPGWGSARPRTPHTRRPPGHPHAAPTARKASTQECALWGS